MNAKTIGYWATTVLLALGLAVGGVFDVKGGPEVAEGMKHLGYPMYVATMIGVWKLLGAAAIVAPGMPLIKEWAYAGIFFDLTGASVSHAASGDPPGNVVTPLVLVLIGAASWALRPESRKLPGVPNLLGGKASEGEAPQAKPAS